MREKKQHWKVIHVNVANLWSAIRITTQHIDAEIISRTEILSYDVLMIPLKYQVCTFWSEFTPLQRIAEFEDSSESVPGIEASIK